MISLLWCPGDAYQVYLWMTHLSVALFTTGFGPLSLGSSIRSFSKERWNYLTYQFGQLSSSQTSPSENSLCFTCRGWKPPYIGQTPTSLTSLRKGVSKVPFILFYKKILWQAFCLLASEKARWSPAALWEPRKLSQGSCSDLEIWPPCVPPESPSVKGCRLQEVGLTIPWMVHARYLP